ncbi:MAG TPA: hypothetical protein GYA08_15465 [Chloroflexi bacterium]|nr:hypothetical protein [Chloroflexota bacterium]
MAKEQFSNVLLMLGAAMLLVFGIMEATGFHTDPLLPAVSAFLIGMTAVLDRSGLRRLR